ncbi:cytoplasmic dynein 2 intermediate chain 2 isoform X2 [Nilaparvata lugens]|uniref:cytoplasmic dynein 2 intermediate chain 2 isoform X2 n=1 Tax=Nilaparvata lugens TaxID=108931 RepID=UPI00193E1C12|nr:cytoplasmic dynein 2 intermediate chain 2 isoform X2 [Nilaparvata lugens]
MENQSSEPAETQTVETIGVEKNEQTSETKDIEIQTERIQELNLSSNYDEHALSTFLNRVGQKIIDEIDKGNRSKAFLSYQLPDEDSSSEVKNVLSLTRPNSAQKKEMKVNCLAWSCTGGVVGLALGHSSHDDWCSHAGLIHFYNIAYSQNSSIEPSREIESTSCVTCLAFHPYEPSFVVCGLVRGTIAMWNLQKDGAETLMSCSAHNDPVTDLCWVQQGAARPSLVSSGQDGRLLIWNVSLLTGSCTLQENFAFNDLEANDVEAGILCFAFSSRRPEQFVVALEGGAIKSCNSSSTKLTTSICNTVPVKNPVIGDLERHNGVVTCVAFSPYHEELLVTVGSDSRILLHSVVKMHLMREIVYDVELTAAAWCLSQANLFIVCDAKGAIKVYDYTNGRNLADFSTNVSTICGASLSLKSPKYLAISDADGKAYILQMPQYFQTG